ncbi:MAG: helix-turn-helix transcriptional regulator [Clostridia bacterium]|nr:helix-turn-helix transcriptional regulator [Clostridia bacterium]
MKKNGSGTNAITQEQQKPELQIARALVEARQEKHVTQQQLAERTGIAQADISRLENGNSNPTLRTLQRLADGLEMVVQVGFRDVQAGDASEDGDEEEFVSFDDEFDDEDDEEYDEDEDEFGFVLDDEDDEDDPF